MLDEHKVDTLFTDFIRSGYKSDDIKQIYETLPYLNREQIRILTLLNTMAVKYNSHVLKEMSDSIHEYARVNRKTGFRFTRLIESFSLYKHFKGYKASSNVGEQNNG